MPLYEYQCAQCGRFEVIRKFSDALLAVCPTCGGEVHKLASAPAIRFKGSGWYVTDYARKPADAKKGDGAKAEGAKAEGPSGDGKAEGAKAESPSSDGKSEGSKPAGSSSAGSSPAGGASSGASTK